MKEGEILKGYPPHFENQPEEAVFAEAYAFPLAQRLGGWELWEKYQSKEELGQLGREALAGEIWKDYLAAWEKQQHSLPVVGTERLETVYSFLTNRASIIEGRSFTEEEYASGARVLILSEKMAARQNLKVGDKLTLQQYNPLYGDPGGIGFSARFSPGHPKNNLAAGFMIGFLSVRGETRTYALMRTLGVRGPHLIGMVLGEQVLLPALSALVIGILTRQPLTALLYFACHLIGCFLAVLRPALATPTKLLRVQE